MENKKTYLMTGGTGFLGTILSARLIKEGHKIIFLGRTKDGIDIDTRIKDCLWNHKKNLKIESIKTLEVNFSEKDLGLSERALLELKNEKIDGLWHLAANLSFRSKKREEVFSTNTYSLKNILDFTQKVETPFLFTSTAYIHGKTKGILLEENTTKPKKFNNPYEESKFQAEEIVKKWSEEDSKNRYIIFRPSLLVEKEKTFFSLSGYYVMLASLLKLRNNLERFHDEHPFLSKLLGIKNEDGILKTKIPFVYSKKGHLNLIPVETTIDWMIEIAENEKSLNKIFHITNPNPFSMEDIVENTFRALKVEFLSAPTNDVIVGLYIHSLKMLGLLAKPLRGFANKLSYYKFYMAEDRTFDIRNSLYLENYEKYSQMKLDPSFIQETVISFIKKLD